jgi:hypothetical protein
MPPYKMTNAPDQNTTDLDMSQLEKQLNELVGFELDVSEWTSSQEYVRKRMVAVDIVAPDQKRRVMVFGVKLGLVKGKRPRCSKSRLKKKRVYSRFSKKLTVIAKHGFNKDTPTDGIKDIDKTQFCCTNLRLIVGRH